MCGMFWLQWPVFMNSVISVINFLIVTESCKLKAWEDICKITMNVARGEGKLHQTWTHSKCWLTPPHISSLAAFKPLLNLLILSIYSSIYNFSALPPPFFSFLFSFYSYTFLFFSWCLLNHCVLDVIHYLRQSLGLRKDVCKTTAKAHMRIQSHICNWGKTVLSLIYSTFY